MSTLATAQDTLVPVGVAEVEITPKFPVRLNGFGGRRKESDGVRQPLKAQALAIGADAPKVLLTIDTLGIADWLREELLRRLSPLGVRRENLALCATHTHSAPMIRDLAPTLFGEPIPPEHQANIEKYSVDLIDRLEKLAKQALANRQPAKLAYGLGRVGFARNRRTAGGPVDHDLPILTVRDPSGRLRAVWTNYACHCVTLSDNLISGDWAGYAVERIERNHPGCVALLSIGCGADANPSSGVTGGNATAAEAHGVEIATEVDKLLNARLVPLKEPATKLATLELALALLPSRPEWERRSRLPGAVGHHARYQLQRIDRGQTLPDRVLYPVQTWTFGDDLAMVFLPGEVVVDYALRLKRELDGPRLWMNAYSNSSPGYVPSERILREGGYEGGGAMIYYGIPQPYASGAEERIVRAVRKQLAPAFLPAIDIRKTQGSAPRRPEHSLATLRTLPDLTIDLIAAEPLLSSPVALDFGFKGEVFVAEMVDYPMGVGGKFEPGGRVRRLTDSNGDGVWDHANVFLDNIPFPTGVTAWRDGVLVCAAPDILFARDTNEDGKADEIRKLYSGFGTGNYQARVNSLTFGLDGWVHGSCGLFGGTITSFSGTKLELGNRDFRIQPDTGAIEPVSGVTQQGRPCDDWGNWFGCDNSNFVRHYPLDDALLRRNALFSAPATSASHFSDPDPGRLFSISQPTLFPLSGPPNRVTAACGLTIYRDTLLGQSVRGDAFTCEPVSNAVHHLRLTPRNSTFVIGRPPEETEREFLASTDTWFRPVQAKTGLDGALWIVDMYRYVIEHPRWIPADLVRTIDTRAGSEMGRIYRVRPRASSSKPWPNFHERTSAELVSLLESSNGQVRDMARQSLVWRRDATIAEKVLQLVHSAKAPESRLACLATLDNRGTLNETTLVKSLADPAPMVRRWALHLAGPRLQSGNKALANAVRNAQADENEFVRLAATFAAGALPNDDASEVLASMLSRPDGDTYLRSAALSSISPGNVEDVFHRLAQQPESQPAREALVPLIKFSATWGKTKSLESLLANLASTPSSQWTPAQLSLAENAVRALPATSPARAGLKPILAESRTIAGSASASESLRVAALGLLRWNREDEAETLEVLNSLLAPQTPIAVQSAALAAICRNPTQLAQETLLRAWSTFSPQRRQQAIDVLLERPEGVAALVAGLHDRKLTPGDFDGGRQQRLYQLANSEQRKRIDARTHPSISDREQVVASHQDVIRLSGDRQRGKAIFAKRCATCHRLDGVGTDVGPNLGALTNRSPQALLIAVLDPNRQLDSRYLAYLASTTDGRVLSGMLTNETATGFALKAQDGKETILLRQEIQELKATGKSFMPEGLEREISKPELADLFAYLASQEPPAKSAPGNKPAVAGVDSHGNLTLSASSAEIRGGEITFETPFQNIGMWSGSQDYLTWQARLNQSDRFDVWIDYACDPGSAGNRFALDTGRQTVEAVVKTTGGWDQYRQIHLGQVALPAGEHRITLRPVGPIRNALLDLRKIELRPIRP